ncbi:MAG TPA: c-type cytochrome [Pseudolabrys sp.]|nr:c-type cytochrome [Pseudolabrys sp.]
MSLLTAMPAFAADIESGRRIAQQRCASCHVVIPNQRAEVADSPPFATIAQKHGFDADAIAAMVLAPHPRMNLMLRPSEALDIAAYIAALPR